MVPSQSGKRLKQTFGLTTTSPESLKSKLATLLADIVGRGSEKDCTMNRFRLESLPGK